MDDSSARKEWNWKPKYSLDEMAKDIIDKLKDRLAKTGSIYPNVDKVSKLFGRFESLTSQTRISFRAD